jgi:hypothetical protein
MNRTVNELHLTDDEGKLIRAMLDLVLSNSLFRGQVEELLEAEQAEYDAASIGTVLLDKLMGE